MGIKRKATNWYRSVTKRFKSYIINTVLLIAVYFVIEMLARGGVLNSYYMDMIKLVFINILLATSLNLVTGFLGQLALGHAGFLSVGAYTSALITLNTDLPVFIKFPLSLVAGGIVAVIFGFIIGIPALRLKGDYLAILTLGFGEIIRVIINVSGKLTGGAIGLSGIEGLSSFGWIYFFTIISVVIMLSFINSRHGRAVISIRENEIAAEAAGINTTYYKLLAFVMAAFFAGIAGGLYAHHIRILSPDKFDFNYSIQILVIVVLGGIGSMTGSVVAAIILTILPELLRDFSNYRMVVYALLLIIMMLFKPSGLLGKYEFSFSKTFDNFKKLIQRKTAKRQGGE